MRELCWVKSQLLSWQNVYNIDTASVAGWRHLRLSKNWWCWESIPTVVKRQLFHDNDEWFRQTFGSRESGDFSSRPVDRSWLVKFRDLWDPTSRCWCRNLDCLRSIHWFSSWSSGDSRPSFLERHFLHVFLFSNFLITKGLLPHNDSAFLYLFHNTHLWK